MTRREFVEAFQKRLLEQFPNGYQQWWPKVIFHFSDVNNIISILNSGKLYSRQKAIEKGLMKNDNADDDVMRKTEGQYKKYVRCYFGAKTPTQYNNEGIKPRNRIKDNAHCPVPVFLLFDFVKLLSRDDTCFSGGNVAAQNADVYTNISSLNDLEFHHIYSRGPLPEEGRGHINYCRQAEVLIPDELDVYDYLKLVCVRTKAEKDTLLYSLGQEAKDKLKDKIVIFTNEGLFEKNELFIRDVQLVDNKVVMHFSRKSYDKFDIELIGKDLQTGQEFNTYVQNIEFDNNTIPWLLGEYTVGKEGFYFCFKINKHLVYQNILLGMDEEIF